MNAVVILMRVSKENALGLKVEDLVACDGREMCCEQDQEMLFGLSNFDCGVTRVCFGFSQNVS
jgi:hypothetical protein